MVLQLAQVVFIVSHAAAGASEIQFQFKGVSLDHSKQQKMGKCLEECQFLGGFNIP